MVRRRGGSDGGLYKEEFGAQGAEAGHVP